MRILIIPEFDYSGDHIFTAQLMERLAIAAPSLRVFPVGALANALGEESIELSKESKNKVLLNAMSGLAFSKVTTPEDAYIDIIIGLVPKDFDYKFDAVLATSKSLTGLQVSEVEKFLTAAEVDIGSGFYSEDDITFIGTMEEIVREVQQLTGSLLRGERR